MIRTKWYKCARCDAGYPDQECTCAMRELSDAEHRVGDLLAVYENRDYLTGQNEEKITLGIIGSIDGQRATILWVDGKFVNSLYQLRDIVEFKRELKILMDNDPKDWRSVFNKLRND